MSTPIRLVTRIEGGQLINLKNLKRIRAFSTELCTSVISSHIDPKTYRESYVILRENEGYIFREITHGMGICGHRRTVRALVLAAARLMHIEVLDAPIEDDVFERTAKIVAWSAGNPRTRGPFPFGAP